MFDPDIKDTINQLTLRPVKSAESLTALQKQESDVQFEVRLKPLSGELDDIAPLEAVTEAVGNMGRKQDDTSMKGHERSSSHDSYFKHKFSSRHTTDDTASSGKGSEVANKQVLNTFLPSCLHRPCKNCHIWSQGNHKKHQFVFQKSPKLNHDQEGSLEFSPKMHSKMSFRKKLKCFTSPTALRRDSDESNSSTAASSLQSNEVSLYLF